MAALRTRPDTVMWPVAPLTVEAPVVSVMWPQTFLKRHPLHAHRLSQDNRVRTTREAAYHHNQDKSPCLPVALVVHTSDKNGTRHASAVASVFLSALIFSYFCSSHTTRWRGSRGWVVPLNRYISSTPHTGQLRVRWVHALSSEVSHVTVRSLVQWTHHRVSSLSLMVTEISLNFHVFLATHRVLPLACASTASASNVRHAVEEICAPSK